MKRLQISKSTAQFVEAITLIVCLTLAFLLNSYAVKASTIAHEKDSLQKEKAGTAPLFSAEEEAFFYEILAFGDSLSMLAEGIKNDEFTVNTMLVYNVQGELVDKAVLSAGDKKHGILSSQTEKLMTIGDTAYYLLSPTTDEILLMQKNTL